MERQVSFQRSNANRRGQSGLGSARKGHCAIVLLVAVIGIGGICVLGMFVRSAISSKSKKLELVCPEPFIQLVENSELHRSIWFSSPFRSENSLGTRGAVGDQELRFSDHRNRCVTRNRG